MSFKMTYQALNNGTINSALTKLANHTGFKVKTAYQVSKIVPRIHKEITLARELFQKLLMKYAEKGADGVIEFENGAPKVAEGNQAAFEKELEEMMAIEFTVNHKKLELDELEDVDLSAAELAAIDPLIHDSSEGSEESEAEAS